MERAPKSVLIIGAGVFGLSTARAFTKRPEFDDTAITVVDNGRGCFPATDSASCDSSRIIRADYADAAYTTLAVEAQKEWRKQGDEELGGQGRYTESGFVLMADEPTQVKVGKKSGMDFTRESWQNVVEISRERGFPADKIEPLENGEALKACLGLETPPGDWGYLNRLSGWADAERGMAWVYRQVESTGRVSFVDAEAQEIITEGGRVVGAQMTDGTRLEADVVLVAAGAWSGSLVDLRGRVEATGHPLGYVNITEEERRVLAERPVSLSLSNGLFVIPPSGTLLKVARHSFGYLNPALVPRALPPSPRHERRPFVTSCPATARSGTVLLPAEADRELRRALASLVPVRGLEERPWAQTRLCWYADTPDGDWLVDWHPGWEGLFIATGDSGHGYKFLPVLGDKVVDCMLGQGGELGRKWRWKVEAVVNEAAGTEVAGVYKALITEDGSRSGRPGMILSQEMGVASRH